MKKEYLLGNDAIAYGLLEGGIEASFAYPGTPSSEITEKLIELSKTHGFYTEWSVNEKSAYENAYGVSLTGRRAAAIMKHVGLNVASDAFITSAYTGIIGGLVLVVADDPYAHSSQNEQDSRRYALLAKIPYLEPSSIQEAKDMAAFAFSLSEKTGLPVMLRSVTRISHGKSDVELGKLNHIKRDSQFRKDPSRFVMVPSNARTALKRLNEKQPVLKKIMEEMPFNKTDGNPSETGIVASGISYPYIMEMKAEENLPVAVFKASTFPLPENKLALFIKGKKKILVLEEGDPVIEEKIYIISKSCNPLVCISGRMNGIVPEGGELSVDLLKKILKKVSGAEEKQQGEPESPASLPVRMPVLCPGCSHTGSFYILKKVFGKDALFPGDIGCYTLGIQSGTIDTCLCMGGGINTGSGMSRFEKEREVISIIGDSTFFHAGITGLINACYNKANQIIAILDNRTTAMTGHQPHPGTGITAGGEKSAGIDIEKIAYACGAEKVVTIDPYRIKESVQKLKALKGKKGVRVIIAKRGCIFVERKQKEKFRVDAEKCTGCKICMQINCPAITFKENKAAISLYCTGCGICAEICPAGAIKKYEKM
ncbi:MAG: indolepyruvate ferredoxin oxidoreductase subunit alpha [Candidatus Omnitrophica bacterium]|nr:indolepyruvate ferredoxin oxidoreductase subunit alpha [Candidatus Omnitrophota bacterium]